MNPEQYQSHLVSSAIQQTVFLLLTYGLLQVLALRRCTGWRRLAVGLPLLLMVPMIATAAQPNTHRDGSLFAIYFIILYLPVMIYLATFMFFGRRITLTRASSSEHQTPADEDLSTGS